MARIKKDGLLLLVTALERVNNNIMRKQDVEEEVYTWCKTQAIDLQRYFEDVYEDIDIFTLVDALGNYCKWIDDLKKTENETKKYDIVGKIRECLNIAEEEIKTALPPDEE